MKTRVEFTGHAVLSLRGEVIDVEAVNQIHDYFKERVRVGCDDAHAHSAMKGCIVAKEPGDDASVIICQLCEELLRINGIIDKTVDAVRNGRSLH